MMRRWLLIGLLLIGGGLHASPRKGNPARAAAPSKVWIVKKAGEGTWCGFGSQRAAQDGIASEAFDAENRAIVEHNRTRIVSIEISNDDDDSYADDLYQFDAAMRLVRMVRTGRTGKEPGFSLTYMPDRTGDLVLTPESRIALQRLDDADRDTDISDWPHYRGFDHMPFRSLITLRPAWSVRRGCALAAP